MVVGSCMMIPNKSGGFTKVLREQKRSSCFENKETQSMEGYVDSGLGNYAILSEDDMEKAL